MARGLPRAVQPLPLEIGVPAGRVVVRQGEACGPPSVVTAGALFVSTVDPEGRVLGLDVAGPGDVVGEPIARPARATARALRPCRLTPAPADELISLVDKQAERMLALACQLAWLDVTARVHHRLLDLARRFGRPIPGGTLLALGLTQEDLAHLCGTSRETANRAIHALVTLGRLELRGRGRFVLGPDQTSGVGTGSADPPPSCSITRLHVPQ